MIGSWKWNLSASFVTAGLIFFISYSTNPLQTTLYRTAVSFIILFAMTYAVRWMLGQAMQSDSDRTKGQRIDMVTPEESEAQNKPVQEASSEPSQLAAHSDPAEETVEFAPLTPPKLVRTADTLDPKQTADTIREMAKK